MVLKSLRVALVILALSGSGLLAQAQSGPSGPMPGPGTPPSGPLSPSAVGRLTPASIVAFLRSQPGISAETTQQGNVAVTIRRDGWTYNVNVILHKDGKGFNLEGPLGSISQRSTAQLVALMQENDRVNMHNLAFRFTCWKQNQQLYLMAYGFNSRMTEAQLLDNLVRFTRILYDTYESWKPRAGAAVPQ